MPHPHSNLVSITDNVNIDGSSLAANTGVLGPSKIDATREQGFRTLMQHGVIDWQASDGSGGPLLVGFTTQDMSLAQLEAILEQDPQDDFDPDEREISRRRIHKLGYLQVTNGGPVGVALEIRRKIQWSYPEGSSMNYFIYNIGGAALDAANNVRFFCTHTGVWLRD